jgi:nucleoside 2-deoxyribosyltransferase
VKVYLAGPISGQTYEGAVDWRNIARTNLNLAGITAYSPMRREEYLVEHQLMPDAPDEYDGVPIEPESIVVRDRFDVMSCDIILMNLSGATKVSIGSMLEAGWADAFRKILIVVMEEDNIHNHAMLRGLASYVVPTVYEGLTLCKTILLP